MEIYQELGYKNDADNIEQDLKKEGYVSSDIVAIAYFLLKNNITQAEMLHVKEDEIDKLLSRAGNLLNKS